MLYLYLDESGDLGFDFVNHKPTVHFTIAVLEIHGFDNNRALGTAVKLTLRRKLKALRGESSGELKGSAADLATKKYFYGIARPIPFRIYSITVQKEAAMQDFCQDKERIYNYLSYLVLNRVSLNDSHVRVIITVDKRKTRPQIREFNRHIIAQVESRLNPHVPLEILHMSSQEVPQLQAADLFAWGIFRKYERKDTEWLNIFSARVVFDGIYKG
ncbi:MAG: hypothetical protein A2016_10705 [Elusimicrobia bacterium GWF2_62_30]|nr:MAG: hypothetical protein A2016_10705 [Elusimicrobia bacterium GWF2_62_30]